MKILIADDDIELCHLLKEYLEQEAMHVLLAHDGVSAIEMVQEHRFDLLILDVMMPQMTGFEVLQHLRKKDDIAIIMLTAKGEKIDRIVGLEMGADDYIAKPCDPRELVARIRAVTRRSITIEPAKSDKIHLDDLTLIESSREVFIDNKEIELTSTEFDFLLLLTSQAGTLVSRESLSKEVLGKRLQTFDRSIDMHISNLRKKLGPNSAGMTRIKTLRGNGYQYVVNQ